MTAFPKTAVGIVSLAVFVGYLVKLIFNQNTGGDTITKTTQTAQTNLISSINQTVNADGLSAVYGLFSTIQNLFVVLAGFLVSIFLSFATFITAISGLPLVISQLIITILSLGLMFALFSKVIQI